MDLTKMIKESEGNFITDIIDEDIKEGFSRRIHTRFPPEPNGYLHIGSAKAIWINYSIAKKYDGLFNLRYDDTNPAREDDEYVQSIYEDLKWLGAEPDGGIFYGSDYFDKCYEFACKLIKDGKAYVCDLTSEEMREYRGTLTEPGKNSPYRDRTPEENMELFERMKNGEFKDGEKTLRAKIDMASPNMNMRDPAIYRIVHTEHHRQGNKWCIYPLYDFAHPLQDAIEGITHSLCSLEFENHRPLYEWVVDNVGFEFPPKQREFARLNVTYTVMSKRYLRELVETKTVDGWDDPRMPTLCGLRRRGYTPSAIFEFVNKAGISKANSLVDIRLLEFCIRNELNESAKRKMAVIDPLKITLKNFPEDEVKYVKVPDYPQKEETSYREVPLTRELYIERSDFMEEAPSKFHRLKMGNEVRLTGTYFIKCEEVIKDESGEIKELICSYDPETFTGSAPDGRKVKGTIHWVSAKYGIEAAINMYDRLFTQENMGDMEEGKTLSDYINPDSVITKKAVLEPSLKDEKDDERFQFIRNGYFIKDFKNKNAYNLIVSLKDSFKL